MMMICWNEIFKRIKRIGFTGTVLAAAWVPLVVLSSTMNMLGDSSLIIYVTQKTSKAYCSWNMGLRFKLGFWLVPWISHTWKLLAFPFAYESDCIFFYKRLYCKKSYSVSQQMFAGQFFHHIHHDNWLGRPATWNSANWCPHLQLS